MATPIDIITASLKEIGVLAAGETLSAADGADGFARLNRFMDRLAADNLTIYTVTRSTKAVTPSQATYTIGPSGDFNIARPQFIQNFTFVDTSTNPDMELPLGTYTEDQWAGVVLKALTNQYPQAVYYNPTFPLGTITPWPTPTSATLLLVVYAWTALTQFTNLTTAQQLPPGYEEMIVQNLALYLCPSYGVTPHPVLVDSARTAMANIKRANTRINVMKFTADMLPQTNRGGWDIYSGDYLTPGV